MRKNLGKRLFALCLSFFMLASFVPTNILAAESDLTGQISGDVIEQEITDVDFNSEQKVQDEESKIGQDTQIEESSEVDEVAFFIPEDTVKRLTQEEQVQEIEKMQEASDGAQAVEKLEEPITIYDMYRDGSGKNIDSEEEMQEASDEVQAAKESEEGLTAYDMYRDGSGKNIDSGEEMPANIDEEMDKIQAIGGMSIANAGLELIKSFESCKLTAYKAVSTEKYYTIGWGHYGPDVYEGMTITQERADQLLAQDVAEFSGYVNNFSKTNKIDLNQNQFDALVSFTYNVGTAWMSKSTIKTYLVNGIDQYTDAQITDAFLMWNKSGGQVLAGLTRRRKAEAALFLKKPASTSTLPTISGQKVPTDMNVGTSFSISGLISSGSILKEVSVGVYDKTGKCMTGKTVQPNSTSYSIDNIDNDIVFGKLPVGTYRYIVSATNAKGSVELIDKEFEVREIHEHSYVTTITKAKPTANGKIVKKCSQCSHTGTTTVIYAPKTMKLSTTSYTYTGKAKKPSVTIVDSNGNIVDASNYTVSYESGRINVGTYKVTVKFNSSKYEGSSSKTITINPASQKITGSTSYTKNTSSAAFTLDARLAKGDSKLSYTSDNKSVATVNSTTGKVTIKGAGTATITVTAPSTSNYKTAAYKVTVKVNPVKVTLKSVTSPKAGKMLVKWSQNTKTTGYQIQYATNSSFSNDKKVNVTGSVTLYKTLSSLTKGKKYYVRVRCYKTVNGVKYYSAYSNTKSITIKK